MLKTRLLTATAALAMLAGLAAPAFAQAPTATAQTEKAAAAATGKPSTDAPAATAVQGTARAVKEAAVNAQATAPAAPPAGSMAAPAPMAEPALVPLLAPAPTTPMPSPNLVASADITATLRQSPTFTTFVKALDATNLGGLLQNQPGITVFAVPNAAFAALPPGKLDALMADKQGLQKLLLHHLINAKVPGSKIKGARGPIPSGAGDKIILDGSVDGVLKVDNATIIQADVNATNGIIHVVDQIMVAGSVPASLPEASPAAAPAPAATPATPAKVVTKTVTKKKK